MEANPPKENERNFFRANGIIYLAIEDPSAIDSTETPAPEEIDAIAASIGHLKNRLSYLDAETKELTQNLLSIISNMYSAMQASLNKGAKSLITDFTAKRYFASISGESVEILMESSLELGVIKELKMVLPDYPYETVLVLADVIKCEKNDQADTLFNVVFQFKNIGNDSQDKLVKFVNTLQRKKIQTLKSES